MDDKKPVILTVDDEAEVLRAIARDLRSAYGQDYRILRADSGEAGLEALRTLQERGEAVALILSDQRMPSMDGVTFLEQAAVLHPKAKRALLTAYADTNAAIAAINASQVHYYLLKPWDPPEERLYPVLNDLLEDWRASYRPGYSGVRVVGSRWSALTHSIKDFLARNQIPYQFLDVERDANASPIVQRYAEHSLPLVFLPDGAMLSAPQASDVAEALGLRSKASRPFYDLAIIGAGPAGLAAAVYGASEGLNTVLIEREAPGGQAGTSSRIENYLGFPNGLSGADLARRAVAQAQRFGVEIINPQSVEALRIEGPYKHLTLSNGSEISCHALMLSVGVSWRRLPAEGAEALTGLGVFYGAATTEAPACRGETIYVVGAGNSAGQAAIYFADYAAKVVMLVRGDALEAKMSQYLVDRILAHEGIDVLLNTEVTACYGTEHLEGLELYNNRSQSQQRVDTHYIFSFIGAAPHTDWLEGLVARDRRGFVLTGNDLKPEHLRDWPLERLPFPLEASVPGIFAAGDVRHESVKRVASAVGEGSVAVAAMHQHLASL